MPCVPSMEEIRLSATATLRRPAAGAFARPRTNAPAFRQHDALARATLATVSSAADERARRSVAP